MCCLVKLTLFYYYFSTAAKMFTGIPMCALLANKRYELLYNCGIQLLHIGRPLAAFECLMEAVQVYHSSPRLWLRLAECCITANKGVLTLTHTFLKCKMKEPLAFQNVVGICVYLNYHSEVWGW